MRKKNSSLPFSIYFIYIYIYIYSSPQTHAFLELKRCNKAQNICQEGTRWLIRKVETPRFWLDNWTGHGKLRNLIEGPLHENGMVFKVGTTMAIRTSLFHLSTFPYTSVTSFEPPLTPFTPSSTTTPVGITLPMVYLLLAQPISYLRVCPYSYHT